MKISIAMATYNGEAYVGAQLDSFIAQSRLPDELVVADDQSTDATAAIIVAFAARAPFRVRFEVNPQRLGVTRNFDRALALADGDLVLLSDQDDVWLPDKIEALERAAALHPDRGCLINDALLADADLRPVGTTKMQQIASHGLPATAMVQGCCTAFRRDLLRCLLPIPADQQAHDNWLVQMADLLDQVERLPQALQYYRRHGRNASDFFVNRLAVPGLGQRLRERLASVWRRASNPGGLAVEQQFHEAAARRIGEREAELVSCVGQQRMQAAYALATHRSQLLARRAAVRGMPRIRRPGPVLDLWRAGDYALSGGTAGAIKDLLVAAPGRSGTR